LPIQQQWTDRRIENIVGDLLRIGVLLSAVVVLCGGILYLIQYGHAPADYRNFRGEPTDLKSVNGIVRYALALQSRGVIQLGLLLLIATPVARVAFSIFGFVEEKDRLYVVFTVIVLLILLYSLIGSASAV
jgi:uncharacterized membrane protein